MNIDGKLLPFYGDTVVFQLQESEKEQFTDLQHSFAGDLDIFAEPLRKDTFHMTLHDLVNGKELARVENQMLINQYKSRVAFEVLSDYLSRNEFMSEIKMRGTNIYPCGGIALLVGFTPHSEKDFRALLGIYNLFDNFFPLSYPFRPHITLNYFRPNIPTVEQKEFLINLLNEFNPLDFEITLDLKQLVYQHFFDMNNFENILSVTSS